MTKIRSRWNQACAAWLAIGLSAGLLGSSGCMISPIKVRQGTIGTTEVDGVPFYLPTIEKRLYELTKLKREDGTYTTECERVDIVEDVVVPNYGTMYLIRQRDLWFAQDKFGVTLANGILASVNSERDPQVDEMINATVGAAKTIASLAAGVPRAAARPGAVLPDCNDGKRKK